MSFNPGRVKQAQEVILSRKTNKITHPPLYFNNTTVKLTHAQKHLGFHLDNKISFNEHTINKISKTTKGIGLLRRLQPIFPRRSLMIIYKSFIQPHLDYGDVITNLSTHHLQVLFNRGTYS